MSSRVAKKKKAASKKDSPGFETCLSELSEVVNQLENGELSLDESLRLYEQGVSRLKTCYALLNAAEQRIALVRGVDDEGNPISEPFSSDDDVDMMETSAARSRKRTASAKQRRKPDTAAADDESTLF